MAQPSPWAVLSPPLNHLATTRADNLAAVASLFRRCAALEPAAIAPASLAASGPGRRSSPTRRVADLSVFVAPRAWYFTQWMRGPAFSDQSQSDCAAGSIVNRAYSFLRLV